MRMHIQEAGLAQRDAFRKSVNPPSVNRIAGVLLWVLLGLLIFDIRTKNASANDAMRPI